MLAGMTQEQTNEYNRDQCKSIAMGLEAYANGEIYRCPECGEIITFDNEQYDEEAGTYTCQECDETFEEYELEALSLYDYFDDVFDIEYRFGSDRQLRSVKLLVAYGGPNIYIDTASCTVELYWWGDRASYPIDRDVCGEIDNIFEEIFNC